MPSVKLDRLLETHIKRNATSMFMMANCSPLVLVDGNIRTLITPPLSDDDLTTMVEELSKNYTLSTEGYRYTDCQYGSSPNPFWWFRLHIFGESIPEFLLLTRLPDDYRHPDGSISPSQSERLEITHLQNRFHQILDRCMSRRALSAVLLWDCAPLLQVDGKLEPLPGIIDRDELVKMIAYLNTPPFTPHPSKDGFTYINLSYGGQWRFRMHLFGQPAPTFAILSRIPDENAGKNSSSDNSSQ
jgi:Tfp pilus assembly pilus retraction ATPase PilT